MQREVSITVPISRTIQDYREAYGHLRWRSWGWPLTVLIYVVISLVLFATKGVSEFWFIGLWGAILVVSYILGLSGIASRMQKAHLKNGPTSYTFDDEGFQYQSSLSQSRTSWTAVNRAMETRRSFLLVYANTCFLIIPKRCLPAGASEPFRAMLRNSLGAKARVAPAR